MKKPSTWARALLLGVLIAACLSVPMLAVVVGCLAGAGLLVVLVAIAMGDLDKP